MPPSAAELPRHAHEQGLIDFEQPLTERIRTFLRLEFLYQQALFHIEAPTDFGARAAVSSLLEMLAILGRGDARAEVLKELERQADALARFRRQPGVDLARLQRLIDNVDELRAGLASVGPHFMSPLKECEFLNTIKHRSSIPGGTCMFDLPDYGYWLRLPHSRQVAQFERWIATLRPLCDAVAEIMWLLRETNDPVERTAPSGLYQHTLDRTGQSSLVRILLPADAGVYPEISAGQHRFTVRFVQWNGAEARPTQVGSSVEFLLALC